MRNHPVIILIRIIVIYLPRRRVTVDSEITNFNRIISRVNNSNLNNFKTKLKRKK